MEFTLSEDDEREIGEDVGSFSADSVNGYRIECDHEGEEMACSIHGSLYENYEAGLAIGRQISDDGREWYEIHREMLNDPEIVEFQFTADEVNINGWPTDDVEYEADGRTSSFEVGSYEFKCEDRGDGEVSCLIDD